MDTGLQDTNKDVVFGTLKLAVLADRNLGKIRKIDDRIVGDDLASHILGQKKRS